MRTSKSVLGPTSGYPLVSHDKWSLPLIWIPARLGFWQERLVSNVSLATDAFMAAQQARVSSQPMSKIWKQNLVPPEVSGVVVVRLTE